MDVTTIPYGAYGEHTRATVRAAYTGEVIEAGTGWYVLGQRLYHPVLRRFIGPDTHSPFDEGGINRYAYCGGDPINHVDPTGTRFWKWFGVALGVVGAVIATVATAGIAAAGIAAGITPMLVATTVANVISIAADVASIAATLANKPQLASILGYIGLGFGVAGMAGSIGSGVSKVAQLGQRATGKIRQGLGRLAYRADAVWQSGVSSAMSRTAGARGVASGIARGGAPLRQGMRTGVASAAPPSALVPRGSASASGDAVRAAAPMEGQGLLAGARDKVTSFYRRFVRESDIEDYGLGRSQFVGELALTGGTVAVEAGVRGSPSSMLPPPPPSIRPESAGAWRPDDMPPYFGREAWRDDTMYAYMASVLNVHVGEAYTLP